MQAHKHAAAAVGWSVTDAGWCQVDNSSKPMSLKLIMEREKVDHMLATGQVCALGEWVETYARRCTQSPACITSCLRAAFAEALP